MYHTLTSETTGRTLRVRFRPFMPEDASALVTCIRSEYGDTYFKRGFYDGETLIRENAGGHIRFLTAETEDGDVAGMLALKRFLPREEMCEIASQIFKPEYRGYHMAWPFFLYGMENIDAMGATAAYCLPVLFHRVTQALMERMGLSPCGFIFSVFLMEGIRHSYPRDANRKHPQGIMVQAKERRNAGILYVPKVHRAFTAELYGALGADFLLREGDEGLRGESTLLFENDDLQQSCTIHVDRAGADLAHRVAALRRRYDEPLQTFNVFLNVSDPSAPAAYRVLTGLGYFFAGFQPLCSEREIMVLHDPASVPLELGTLALTPRFQRVMDYVRPFYKERVTG